MVCEDGSGKGIFRVGVRRAGIDGGDDGKVVLELEEVFVCGGVGAVERILEGWVERSEGELVNYVREVEAWAGERNVLARGTMSILLVLRGNKGEGRPEGT